MSKNIIVISCGPGLDDVRKEYGHSYQWVQEACSIEDIHFFQSNAYKGEFPKLNEGDAWIITGSAKSVYDDIDWIVELEMLIKKAYEVEKPILGICFGHQLIAQALGGVVKKNKKGWELGSSTININKEGWASPIFKAIPKDDSFYMSHKDIVEVLPKEAVELAMNDKGNQAYHIGNFIYGVQFHPEFPYDVAEKYAMLRYERKIISSKPSICKSTSSHYVIDNFINSLESDM